MEYQETFTRLQASATNAQTVIAASEIALPVERRVENLDGRLGTVTFDIVRHGAMEVLASRSTGALTVFYANERVLCISHEGVLRDYSDGVWVQELAYLSGWVHDARRAVREPQRCSFHASIRRFFAAAQSRGLDTSSEDAMRRALGWFFNCPIETRRQLNGQMWWQAATAIETGSLAW